jgi:hypothetical protein
MKKYTPFLSLAAGILLLTNCAEFIVTTSPPGTKPGPRAKAAGPPPQALKIPPGHLPAPGECRIWYPGQPPGHQPPPGPCKKLASQVPPGAWLVSRPGKNRKKVEVSVYDADIPGVILVIRLFEAASGKFISERKP